MKGNTGMFRSHWTTLAGEKLGPLQGREIGEAHCLWKEHADIRLRVVPEVVVTDLEALFGLGVPSSPREPVSRVPAATACLAYEQARLGV